MKHTIRKIFLVWQHEKEEKWLNEMSAKGLQLDSVGFCKYVFEEGGYDEYTYRLELLEDWPSQAESTAYLRFLEDAGVEHVGTLFRWVYFRKKSADGAFDLYSDIDSKIKHYTRINRIIFIIGLMNIFPIHNGMDVYFRRGYIGALVGCILEIFIVICALYGFISIEKKIIHLKKEKQVRE